MNLKTKLVFKLSLLLLLLVFTVNTSLALSNTSQKVIQPQYQLIDNYTGNTTDLEGTNNIEQEALLQSYKSFDHTLSMLNTVIAAMGVLVALIGVFFALFALIIGFFALIIGLLTLLGFSGIKSIREIKSSMKKLLTDTQEQSKLTLYEIDKELKIARDMCEDTDKQIKTFMNQLAEDGRKEINEMIKEIPDLLTNKNPSKEIIDRLERQEKRLETMEALGMPLKTDDLLNRGISLYIKKQYDDAITVFDKVLSINPKNFTALSYKGSSLAELEMFSEAIKICDMALEIRKDDSLVLSVKGYSLINIDKYEDALKIYDKILKKDPYDCVALTNKGYSLANMGKFSEALKIINEALRIDPEDPETFYGRASIYSLMKDKEHAIQDLKQSIELDSSLKQRARNEEDFKNFEDLWNDANFKETIE